MSGPSEHLAPLAPVLGRWRSSGVVLDQDGTTTAEIAGTDTYTLLPGGHWIAHAVDVDMGDGQAMLVHELIGGEHPDGGWAMHAFDASPAPGVMRLSRERPDLLLLGGDGVRSWFAFRAGPDHMTTDWERRVDGEWIAWMRMRFDRA